MVWFVDILGIVPTHLNALKHFRGRILIEMKADNDVVAREQDTVS